MISTGGNVGIGTTNPDSKLGIVASGAGWAGHFSGSAYGIYSQSSSGYGVYAHSLTGAGVYAISTTFIGVQGQSAASGGGYFTDVYGAYVNGSGYDAYLGYPGYSLYSAWPVYAGGFQQASDIRLKTALRPLPDEDGLAAILKLQPVNYRWKDAKRDAEDGEQMGFIAQDVEQVFPNLAVIAATTTITHVDGTIETISGTKGLDYSKLTVPLVKAVQEQQAEIESLKADNAALKRGIEELRSALRTK